MKICPIQVAPHMILWFTWYSYAFGVSPLTILYFSFQAPPPNPHSPPQGCPTTRWTTASPLSSPPPPPSPSSCPPSPPSTPTRLPWWTTASASRPDLPPSSAWHPTTSNYEGARDLVRFWRLQNIWGIWVLSRYFGLERTVLMPRGEVVCLFKQWFWWCKINPMYYNSLQWYVDSTQC